MSQRTDCTNQGSAERCFRGSEAVNSPQVIHKAVRLIFMSSRANSPRRDDRYGLGYSGPLLLRAASR